MKRLLLFLFLLGASLVFFEVFKNRFQQKTIEPKIQGIIVPHHGLAKEILNTSFAKLRQSTDPETIVIYGTNHYFPISETYTTTAQVKSEFGLTDVLAGDARIKGDHSIFTITPYIAEYFPKARIIPIIVSTKYQSIEALDSDVKDFVKVFGSDKTLYLASVDFAHNVTLAEGINKNKESIASISTFNYNEILGYHDDHMDSPLAITTLMLTMQNLGATNWQTWYSNHGALITDILDLRGTSYVVGVFSKK